MESNGSSFGFPFSEPKCGAESISFKEEDIDVSAVGDTLTIKGERKAKSEVKEEDHYCCERSYGSFFRSIALPSNINAQKIEATFEDGVLEIRPKAPFCEA